MTEITYIFGNKKMIYGACDDLEKIPGIIESIVPNSSVITTERNDRFIVVSEDKTEVWKADRVADYTKCFISYTLSLN